MVDEDDDYMADLSRFLPTESATPPVHGRNGKSRTGSKDKVPKKANKKVTDEQRRKAEDEQRTEGLGSAISSTNIGFKMLQSMGYAPGAALGKHGQGLLEPVNIDFKRSRTGLGRDNVVKEEAAVKAKRAEIEERRNRQKERELKVDFQERRRGTWHNRKIISNYRKACATFMQLEESSSSSTSATQQGEVVPQEIRSLRDGSVTAEKNEDKAAEEEEEEEEITSEMLREIVQKLRSQYNYCLYCGCKYDSFEALLAECPGMEEDDH